MKPEDKARLKSGLAELVQTAADTAKQRVHDGSATDGERRFVAVYKYLSDFAAASRRRRDQDLGP